MDASTALARVELADRERAAQNLARIAARVSPGLAETLPTLLSDSPDPDSALNLFERLTAEAGEELLRLLDRHRFLAHYALVVFAHSPYLGETLLQNRDLFPALARERTLDRSHSREDFRESFARFRSRSFETDIALLLARFKRREYVRVMLRDVLSIATLAETTAEISALSDVLIEEALGEAAAMMRNRYANAPQHTDAQGRLADTPFAVLSLGKLGGSELNYSSDVDLLYLYGDATDAGGSEISAREFFVRLAQQTTEILGRVTAEGAPFRIDLRLRPQGAEGESAIGIRHALRYYAETAGDWERQALIKARYSAGDIALAREFLRGVQPHVYTAQVNFPAIETAMNAREKMGARRRGSATLRAAAGVDVKLDRGGIRDIEFLVQCLQRVYGGGEPWLRSGGTLFSLQKLHDKAHLSGKDFHELTSSYVFLRELEHRLQLRRGLQTHRLPGTPAELRVIARSMRGELGTEASVEGFVEAVRSRMAAVAEIYDRIIHRQRQHGEDAAEGEFRLRALSSDSGREQSYSQILERLAADAPALYEIASRRDLGAHTRRNLHRFLSSAFTSGERYAAVLRAAGTMERALRIFAASEFLTDILIQHPEEIATVAEAESPAPLALEALFEVPAAPQDASDGVFRYLADAELARGEKLALLRRHYRHRVFAVGVRDLLELRSAYDSHAEMTAAADAAIRAALAVCGAPAGFAVMALGRLGTNEFDIASDADLLFVRAETSDKLEATRAAEQMVEALAAYTQEGALFAVDSRLRPHGAEGELVITPAQLRDYFAAEAQAWEALSYTKVRAVAGAPAVADDAARAVRQAAARFAADPGFPAAVREMRTRLEKSEAGEENFKVTPGGFYDIDFVASYLLVQHGWDEVRGNIRDTLRRLAEAGRLSDADCATLENAAELKRTLEHVIRLVTGRARKSLPATEYARQTAEHLTQKTLGQTFPQGLGPALRQARQAVREVYDRIVR